MYADMEEGFVKTHISVKEACISGEPTVERMIRHVGRGNLPENVHM